MDDVYYFLEGSSQRSSFKSIFQPACEAMDVFGLPQDLDPSVRLEEDGEVVSIPADTDTMCEAYGEEGTMRNDQTICPHPQSDNWEISPIRPDFPPSTPLSDSPSDQPEPEANSPSVSSLRTALFRLLHKSFKLFDMYTEKRRNHMKYKDEAPSVLAGFSPSAETQFHPSDLPLVRSIHTTIMTEARRHIFQCEDFRSIQTSSLRHTCMGCLADGFKLHIKFVEDVDKLLGMFFQGHFQSVVAEKLAFLRDIEESENLREVCQYSVKTKASSAAKEAVRTLYLDLLALQHHTTPTLAQELVPGFTYDNIQSLDEVVELVECMQPASYDAEIERFRQKLANQKPMGMKLKPVFSDEFIDRLNKRMKGR